MHDTRSSRDQGKRVHNAFFSCTILSSRDQGKRVHNAFSSCTIPNHHVIKAKECIMHFIHAQYQVITWSRQKSAWCIFFMHNTKSSRGQGKRMHHASSSCTIPSHHVIKDSYSTFCLTANWIVRYTAPLAEQNRTEFYFDLYRVHRQLNYNIQK